MRFSILQILAITAYVAIVAAGIASDQEWLKAAVLCVWAALLMWWSIPVPARPERNCFNQTTVRVAVVYIAASLFCLVVDGGASYEGWLPHGLIMRLLLATGDFRTDDDVFVIVLANTSLFVGAACGLVAVWRLRHWTRSINQSP